MDTFSMSNSLSKGSVYESDSIYKAYLDDAQSRLADGVRPEAISNEEIHKGDPILETYRVEDDAIHGGMGSVWRVHHQGWNVNLAMKRPQPRFFSEGSEQRKADFVAECEHWINLGLHPNIVSCYYVRDIGGVPTIFSEWMDGGSLKDAIQSGRLYEGTEEEVQARILDIAIQTARGLQYSHEQGLIHQDVKPGNILLSREWEAKVADFGLAKAQSQLTDGEKPASSGYTLAYCPREQAEGAAAEPWMDVYAWALMVLEMYAGKRLWETGAEAAECLENCIGQCQTAVPAQMKDELSDCLRERMDNLALLEERLKAIYRYTLGRPYRRETPTALMNSSISLNNWALSYMDLGQEEMAKELLQQALEANSGSDDVAFNLALFNWRHGMFSDEECIQFLSMHVEDNALRQEMTEAIYAENDHASANAPLFVTYRTEWEDVLGLEKGLTPNTFGVLVFDSWHLLTYDGGQETWTGRSLETRNAGAVAAVGQDGALVDEDGCWRFYRTNGTRTLYDEEIMQQDSNRDVGTSAADGPGQTHLPVRGRDSIEFLRIEGGKTALYDVQLQPVAEANLTPELEMRLAERYLELYSDSGRLLIVTRRDVDVFDMATGILRSVLHVEDDNNALIMSSQRMDEILSVRTLDEIWVIDLNDFAVKRLPLRGVPVSDYAIMPDGDTIIMLSVEEDTPFSVLRAYSVSQTRCIWTRHDSRDAHKLGFLRSEAYGTVVFMHDAKLKDSCYVRAAGNGEFYVFYHEDYRYDYCERGRRSILCIERYRVPCTAQRCAYRLSRVRSVNENIETAKAFEAALRTAREALESGDAAACLERLEDAYAMDGFEEDEALRALNQQAGRGCAVQAVRYIRPFKEDGSAMWREENKRLVDRERMLTRGKADGDAACEYHLWNWMTGEMLRAFPAAADTVFLCIGSDQSAAFAAEDVKPDCFTLHRMDLLDGTATRRVVSVSVKAEGLRASSYGRRVILASSDGRRIAIDGDSAPVVMPDKLGPFVFTRDGRHVVRTNAISAPPGYPEMTERSGLGGRPRVYKARSLFTSRRVKPLLEMRCSDVKQIAVSAQGAIVLVTRGERMSPLLYPNRSRKGFFEAHCRCAEFAFFIPDDSGVLAIGREGEFSLFQPRTTDDYRILAQYDSKDEFWIISDYGRGCIPKVGSEFIEVPDKAISYTKAGPRIKKDSFVRWTRLQEAMRTRQTVMPAAKMAIGDGMSVNSDGTALLDARQKLWVIDYRYSPQPGKGFQTWERVFRRACADRGLKGVLSRLIGRLIQ